MNQSNYNTVRPDVQDDIIELGVASVETKGNGGMRIEPQGLFVLPEISEE